MFKINKKMLENARKQFCLDTNMPWEEYLEQPDKKVYLHKSVYQPGSSYPGVAGARIAEKGDAFFKAIMCMGQLFLMADESIYDWAMEEFGNCSPEWFCKYENLRKIDEKLWEYGRKIGDTHVYFLPESEESSEKTVALGETDSLTGEKSLQWFEQEEIMQWKENNRFPHALGFSGTQPDMIAVAARKPEIMDEAVEKEAAVCGKHIPVQESMAGMAGVSADGEYLWQIGIDIEKEWGGRGLAAYLVTLLKNEIIRRGKTPFYGTSESHTVSQTVALKSGFVPAWTEIYVERV